MRIAPLALVIVLVAAMPAAAQTDPRTEASAHFERGTDLFNEGRYDAALAEFERAYAIAPALPVLYNLGRVHAELGQPVASARAYQRYLDEGRDTLPAARRIEVERELARQRDRIGHLRVEANVDGAIVSVDGSDVATTPLTAPIDLGGGTHSIGVRAPGYEGVTREVAIAGTAESSLVVDLRREVEARGTLRIDAPLAGVRVLVDGREVGTTPLASTLPVPAGDHDVSGERAGYLSDPHRVRVDEGAEVRVTLRLAIDPDATPDTMGALRVALPTAPSVIRVDEETITTAETPLRIGPHRIAVEVAEREPWSSDLEITRGQTLTLTPPLVWTAVQRASRTGAADTQRTAGIALAVSGAALLAVGAPLLVWNELQIGSTDAGITELNREYASMCAMYDPVICGPLRARGASLQSSRDTQDALRIVSITTTVVGGVIGLLGVVLWATPPSNEQIDAAAHASLRVTPNGLVVDGTF